jgi:hypothetical protein
MIQRDEYVEDTKDNLKGEILQAPTIVPSGTDPL